LSPGSSNWAARESARPIAFSDADLAPSLSPAWARARPNPLKARAWS
jgi:hypothetical protein